MSSLFPSDIPDHCILGIHYSGMKDTSIGLVTSKGVPLLTCSLGALTGYDHDGQDPEKLLAEVPWKKISKVAISSPANYQIPASQDSQLHPQALANKKPVYLKHGMDFYSAFDQVPVEKEFVSHQLSHVTSAFYLSSFDEALCLSYDSPSYNEPWFGGLYRCSRKNTGPQIESLDQFDNAKFANAQVLYTFVLAVLGLDPLHDQEKVLLLASQGSPSKEMQSLLEKWFSEDYQKISKCTRWLDMYAQKNSPKLFVSKSALKPFLDEISSFSAADLCASLLTFIEQHLLGILTRAQERGWTAKNICLTGTLFSHLDIEKAISRLGFENVSTSPLADDEGTALGAAWLLSEKASAVELSLAPPLKMGPQFSPLEIQKTLKEFSIELEAKSPSPAELAKLLAQGHAIALYTGAPSSLEQNLIFHQEKVPVSGLRLKQKSLGSPVVAGQATKTSMTGTILEEYRKITQQPALAIFPFQIDDLPLPTNPQAALLAFFASGISYLYIAQVGLVALANNQTQAIALLRRQLQAPQKRTDLVDTLDAELAGTLTYLEEKEKALVDLKTVTGIDHLTPALAQKEKIIEEQRLALDAYRKAFTAVGPLVRILSYYVLRLQSYQKVRLGILRQYEPKPLRLPKSYLATLGPKNFCKISIVTPSYNQAQYIERTIKSVLDQKYPNLEYFIRDGASKDGTVEVLKKYESQIDGWESLPDSGQSNAINLGFEKTTGEVMAWLNSDDVLLPGSLHAVAKFFEDHPEIDVVYGNRILIDHEDQEIGRWIMPPHENEVLSYADYIPQETMFWRRSIWNKAGGRIDESFQFAMDWDFIARLRDAGAKFYRMPRFIGGFRVHPNQKTSGEINSTGVKEMNLLKLRLLGYLPSEDEVNRKIGSYMRKHILLDLGHRAGNRLLRNLRKFLFLKDSNLTL